MVETPKLPIRYPDFARRLKAAMDARGLKVQNLVEALKEAGSPATYEMVRRYTIGQALPRQDKLEIIARVLGATPADLQFDPITGSASSVQAPNVSHAQGTIGRLSTSVTVGPFEGLNRQISDLKAIGEIPSEAIEMIESALKGAERLTEAMKAKEPLVQRLPTHSSEGNSVPDEKKATPADFVRRKRADVRSAADPEGGMQDESGKRGTGS